MRVISDRSFLDLPDFRKSYLLSGEQIAMKFYVEGIKCGRCAQKIEALEKKINGLYSMRINMSNRQLEISLDDHQTSFASVVHEVENLGFRLIPIKAGDDVGGSMQLEDRKDFLRLGVAAVSASNIMMFSFAIYFGADGYLALVFQWLSFFLYVPVVTFVAWPFYQGLLNAIKQRSLSVDGPIALASVSGFIFSSINLFRGTGSIYFDSLSGFLFLILISRFVQKRLQRNFLSFQNAVPVDFLTRARQQSPGQNIFGWVPTENLRVGDLVKFERGETISVDGVLISDSVQVDSSYLTGESHTLFKNKNMALEAGTILRSGEAVLSVTAVNEKTHFGKLLHEIQQGAIQKVKLQNISDRYSQILLLVVYSTAFIFILMTWAASKEIALERALALIILACPCAMAFGTPLALAFSVKKAMQKGFLIKNGDVFEKILKVKNIFFDKTGTLTGTTLKVKSSFPEFIDQRQASLVLSLENISAHPIANALRNHLMTKSYSTYTMENLVETSGVGVQGHFQNKKYSLHSSESLTQKKSVALYEDSIPLVHFFLQDELLESSKALLQNLVKMNFNVGILSGDSSKEVQQIADAIDLDGAHCFASMSATDKATHVSTFQNTMMIGDGINDSLAFQKADVGIAVHGCIPLALKSADVYFLSTDLTQLNELFTIAKRAIHLVHRNLIISLIYNTVGGIAALMGFINPFVAAVLMPISSGFILLSTWIESRR